MVSLVKTTRNLIGGAIGAFIGWLIVEPIPWLTSDRVQGQPDRGGGMAALLVLGMTIGSTLGGALGAAEGINSGSAKQLRRSTILGVLVGIAGGFLGVFFGQIIYAAFAGGNPSPGAMGILDFVRNLVGRTLGWAAWGLVIGAAQGVISGSPRRITLGALGGVIGGAIGGFAFEILGQVLGFLMGGEVLRLIGFVSIGAGIGLFSSLAQELFKQAWVKVLVGRGEGREFQIAKQTTIIGRDELADVPVFGDTGIARRHLIIQDNQGKYMAQVAEQGLSFLLNGKPMSSAPLSDGDIITIGSRNIEFHEKRTSRRSQIHTVSAPVEPVQNVPVTPPGTCQFCGQPKDALGGCACAVGAPMPVEADVQTQNLAAGQMATSSSWVYLQVVEGPLTGSAYSLSEGVPLTIGRAADAAISIQGDSFVSRLHATVTLNGGQPIIQDEGSTNGTFVNGLKVTRQALKNGDTITIGQTKIRVSA